MSHPQTHSPEDARDSKPWGPGDKGARRGLTQTPTSAGGRASALPPHFFLQRISLQAGPGDPHG